MTAMVIHGPKIAEKHTKTENTIPDPKARKKEHHPKNTKTQYTIPDPKATKNCYFLVCLELSGKSELHRIW